MATSDIKPFRQIDDHDTINGLFAFSGVSADKGTFVSPVGSGYNADNELQMDNLSPFAGSYSSKFNCPQVVIAAASGASRHQVVGLLLHAHATYDENGQRLLWNPRKAAEMDVTITGQATEIATKGLVLYSGIVGDPAFGSGAAIADAGDGSLKVVYPTVVSSGTTLNNPLSIGKFLGRKDANGYALLKLEL